MGSNVVSLGVGTPAQRLNLTLTLNVEYFMVALDSCVGCVHSGGTYIPSASSSLQVTGQTIDYAPTTSWATGDALDLLALVASDIVGAPVDKRCPMLKIEASRWRGGTPVPLPPGSSGFFGLGVHLPDPRLSVLPSLLGISPYASITVGIDMADVASGIAGVVHWGAVPDGVFVGSFNWLPVNLTSGWSFITESVALGAVTVPGAGYLATVDPGIDAIVMPAKLAAQLFAGIEGASRASDSTRWNIPCNATLSLSVKVAGTAYKVDPRGLVTRRGAQCSANIVSWHSGSIPDLAGEIRLGAAFLSGVYSALYYSASEQYIGLAKKTNSVNASAGGSSSKMANGRLAGLVIGLVLAVILLVCFAMYIRNRNSPASVARRAELAEEKAAMDQAQAQLQAHAQAQGQVQVASLVSRFQNAADRDAGAAARDPSRRVSAGAGVAGVLPATRRTSYGVGGGGDGGEPVAKATTPPAVAPSPSPSPAAAAAAKEAKALAPVAPNLPSPTPELVPDTELKKAVTDSSSSPELPGPLAAADKPQQASKKTLAPTTPAARRGGRVSKSPVRKGATPAAPTPRAKKEKPAPAKPAASPSSQPAKLKPSNTGLSSASRHSEVRPQTTGGSRSSPSKPTGGSRSSPSKPTAASLSKSTGAPAPAAAADKTKQRPRSSLGVTGAGATVTRNAQVRSSASATSSKLPPRSSLSAASAGAGAARKGTSPSPTPVATPRAHSPSSTSRLLQGTAASRARAAATASVTTSTRTSPAKTPRTSPNKDVAALKARQTPRGSLAGSNNSTATPVRRSPLTADARGKRPSLGRVGLAAAREAPKSSPTARAKNGVAKVKMVPAAPAAVEAGKGGAEQDGERVLVGSPVEDKHNDDADDEHDDDHDHEHERDESDEEVLDDYDDEDDERLHAHHDYYHHHEREPSSAYINDHTDTSTIGVSDSVSQRMGSPESVPSIPDE
ncbi:hypothetical protein Q8F55_000238 [Vanrija albida]|uniref:Peptidase A1 domain-containing protein n=1 Tax=Vanrija albida TaxID=181172 RepID=A0ABR3QCP5_9TREE